MYILGFFNLTGWQICHRSCCNTNIKNSDNSFLLLFCVTSSPSTPPPPFLIFTAFLLYFPSSPCCSFLNIPSALRFWALISLSVWFLPSVSRLQYFPLSGSLRAFSLPLCLSLTLSFLPHDSGRELHQLQRSLVCVCVCVPPGMWVCCVE